MKMSNEPSHERGNGHPSSLESPHHIGQNGKVIYSPAQLAALENGKAIDRRQAKDASKEDSSPAAWLTHEHVTEEWRADVETDADADAEAETDADAEADADASEEASSEPAEPPQAS